MVLSLYLLWRAIAEVRLPFFLLGGLAMALAAMTRSEGLFLLVPLLLWSFWRGTGIVRVMAPGTPREASALRRKLLLGVMLAVGVFPALLVLASLFWFRGHAPWELVRTKPLEFVEHVAPRGPGKALRPRCGGLRGVRHAVGRKWSDCSPPPCSRA